MSELICVLWPREEGEPVRGSRIKLSGQESHHAVRVRRCAKGTEVWAITGTGAAARCAVIDPDPGATVVEVVEVVNDWREPPRRVTLYQALVRPASMDRIVEQGTTLGMYGLVPLLTERVQRRGVKLERWRRLAAESAKQCGRGWIPFISTALEWEEFTGKIPATALLVASDEANSGLFDILSEPGVIPAEGPVAVVIGPEGGLVSAELEFLRSMGALEVNLGSRRLRSETAAVAVLSLLLIGLNST